MIGDVVMPVRRERTPCDRAYTKIRHQMDTLH
jgi:hypothetical protein